MTPEVKLRVISGSSFDRATRRSCSASQSVQQIAQLMIEPLEGDQLTLLSCVMERGVHFLQFGVADIRVQGAVDEQNRRRNGGGVAQR